MADLNGRKDCPNCGLKLPSTAKICEFCGWDFEDEDDWALEINALEKELLAKGKKGKEPPLDEMVDSSIRDSVSGKPEAPAEPPSEEVHTPGDGSVDSEKASFTGLICPTCGGDLKKDDEYCPSCGADLKEEGDWASEIAELEKELVAKGRKIDKASLDTIIESTIRSPVSGQQEEPYEPEVPGPEEQPGAPVEGMKKCPACGSAIPSEAEICASCGADLEDEEWVTEIEALEKELLIKHEGLPEPAVEETPSEIEAPQEEPQVAALDIEAPEEAEPELEPAPPVPAEEAPEEATEAEQVPPEAFRRAESESVGAREKARRVIMEPPSPPQETRPKPAPQELPKPAKSVAREVAKARPRQARGRVNGVRQGMVNGTKKGMVNGTKQGMVNGTKQGLVNGTRQGMVNGTKQGMVNGTRQGMVNGTKKGKVNGISIGKVNGLKVPAQLGEGKMKSGRFFSRGGSMFQGRRFIIVIIVVAILMISSTLAYLTFTSPEQGIVIDGSFSDWASVPSYSFSTLIPGQLGGVDEGKISFSEQVTSGRLFLYSKLQADMFAGNAVTTLYAFIDSDGDKATGYLTGGSIGADTLITLAGWNGSIQESSCSRYNSTTDQQDWNSWLTQSGYAYRISGRDLEISVNIQSTEPLVQLMTVMGGAETQSPIMSPSGTILARQEPLISGSLATTTSPSVLRVSVAAMGVQSGSYTVQASIVDGSGQPTPSADIVATTSWTTFDLSADLSALSLGDGFRYTFSAASSGFQGAIEVSGEPSSGYLMQYPADIVVDGLFADWDSRKFTDTDTLTVDNPRIDIEEFGVAAQGGRYFMYTGTAGDIFDGADVPEQRSKPTGAQGGGGSTVRIKRTGEDLLQAFIDKDPAANLGKVVSIDNVHIEADILIELFGRDGIVTSSSVSYWSATDNDWLPLGAIEKTGVGIGGVEFSVSKTLLGNLSASEIYFFTTDWKAKSDNCIFNSPLADPWTVRDTASSAGTYHTNDGVSWTDAGSIQLVTGDTVVAMAHSLDRTYVFAVTNTGRVYDWEVNVDSSWGPDVTGPCNSTEIVGLAPNSASGEGGCLILGANGWTWSTSTLGGARGWSNGTSKVAQGADDFRDVCYNSTGERYWAVRSGADTPAYYASLGGSWIAMNQTGSSTVQSHVYHIGDSDTGSPDSEQVFVLCEDGDIRYSADGGSTWTSRGDLPAPGDGALPSYSRYVAIDRDSNGMFWAITNTSYTYKSSDSGASWTYTSNIGVNDIASLACPAAFIPEFESIIIPVLFMAVIVFATKMRRRKRADPPQDEDPSE